MTDLARLTIPLSEWIATASPGDRVIVQTAPHGANDEAQAARQAGQITTSIRRASPRTFDLIAVKLKDTRIDKAPLGRGRVEPMERPMSSRGLKPAIRARVEAVLACRAKGMTRAQVAEKLGISLVMVKRDISTARDEGML